MGSFFAHVRRARLRLARLSQPLIADFTKGAIPTTLRHMYSSGSRLTAVMKRLVLFGFLMGAALSAGTTTHSKFVGTYVAPAMELSLGSDGTATVTEEPGNSTTTLFGHWADADNLVKVTFDAVAGEPGEPAMVFKPAHDGLQAVSWNHATWGKIVPPPLKAKARVKERLTHGGD